MTAGSSVHFIRSLSERITGIIPNLCLSVFELSGVNIAEPNSCFREARNHITKPIGCYDTNC